MKLNLLFLSSSLGCLELASGRVGGSPVILEDDESSSMIERELIRGGSFVTAGTYPWFSRPLGGNMCGGSLVTPEFVLTAAHCVDNNAPIQAVKVGALCDNDGLTNCGQTFEQIRKRNMFIHPDWNEATAVHDIALIQLEGRSNIAPVPMNQQSSPSILAPGTELWASGFGHTSAANGQNSDKLKHVEMVYMDQQLCGARYTTLTDDMMCVLSDSPPNGTCVGDSGGPIYDTVNNMVFGANSWGKGSCGGNDPNVFSRVGEQFESWIKPTICDNHSLPKPDFCSPNPPLPPPAIKTSYYDADNWTDLPVAGLKSLSPFKTEIIGAIDFPYTNEPFAGSGEMYNVAALFEGKLHFPVTGTYKLCIRSDDGSKIYMDGDEIINHDGIHGADMKCVDKNIDAGDHEVSVEYFQADGGHLLRLLWQKPGDSSVFTIGQYDWKSVRCNVDDIFGQTFFLPGVPTANACWRVQLGTGGTLEGDFTDPSCSKDESKWKSTNGVFSIFDGVSVSMQTAAFTPGTNGYFGTFQFIENTTVTKASLQVLSSTAKEFAIQVTIPTCSPDAICPTMKVDL